ncbi:RagB/SusD family nutrient uptake outer membrane protein [Pseudoflavitalea sp. X16]|uniref:RagB/SusD family nutrient uptake outer membrane protein n=1 Tax=Paraflavitalea devenefica TaxID=2716334 RepID=UPI0014209E67|nr:RagB/SusD family nutrient uptake outer membrane protein [Paraflavitalea devenefica]NII25844.1 RagB/SusD family nutrient uptake outer membrane protein [Paraflavitalea devenefica]
MNTTIIYLKKIILSMRTKSRLFAPIGIGIAFSISSCKKLVDVPAPTNSIAENNVYSSDATAISVLTALYSSMNEKTITNPIQGNGSIALHTGMSSDELTLYSGVTDQVYLAYYQNALQVNIPPGSGYNHWAPLYHYVFKSNAAIKGLSASKSLTSAVKQQLLGEAKFMRAFFYYYLVNLYGDVPLAVTTDPQNNSMLARLPKEQVYLQIIADLKDAQELLSADYLNQTLLSSTTERVRPIRWAAAALLARVYLFTEDYAKAETQASTVINNTALYTLPALNDVFLKNSQEAIWQLQPTDIDFNTVEAQTLIIPPTGPSLGTVDNPVYLSNNLLSSFESGDQRAVHGNWVDTTIFNITPTTYDTVAYAYKYKINTSPGITSAADMTEYFMMLRLGEQFLIRAEARTQQNNIVGAQSDLNAIRVRAGLPNTAANDKTSLLAAILHERQVELFSEWGHRWLDLKRTRNVDKVMNVVTPQKASGAPWKSHQQLYPIPLSDLQSSPNLAQNTGY